MTTPCFNCENRCVNCHAECEDYANFLDKHAEHKNKIHRAKQQEHLFDNKRKPIRENGANNLKL